MENKINAFLDNDIKVNQLESWSNLNKTIKLRKIIEYIALFKIENKLTDEEEEKLNEFLKQSLENKKLERVKDVIYDKSTGTIKKIPGLIYNKNNKHFSLKNMDKRTSTLKSLKL
jgi:hypothetical protein